MKKTFSLKKLKNLRPKLQKIILKQKKIVSDFKHKNTLVELSKREYLVELQRKELEIENEQKKQEQKTELLEQNLIEFRSQQKTLGIMALEFETKFSRVELEKKKLSSELHRNESLIELEEKRIDQKAYDLEARMAKFAFEQNNATIELEGKNTGVIKLVTPPLRSQIFKNFKSFSWVLTFHVFEKFLTVCH